MEMWTRRPAPCLIIWRPKRCEAMNVPVRLTLMTSFQSERGRSSMGEKRRMPAVLTRTSTRPKSATAASTAAWTSASSQAFMR